MTEIRIPEDLWEDDMDGVLVTWLLDEGDRVHAGDAVAEVMVEKAQYEIVATASGILRQLLAPDDPVRTGTVIGRMDNA